MGQSFSRFTVNHSPAPRRTSHRSSHHEAKSPSNPPSPGRPQIRRVNSKVTSSSPIHPEQKRQHRPVKSQPDLYFSARSNPVRGQRPSSSGNIRTPVTQHLPRTGTTLQEPFTPLPPTKTSQSQGSPKKSPAVESSHSSSSGTSSSNSSSLLWSGPMPPAPMPPNWDRDFYSGISPRHLRDVRSSQREHGYNEIHRRPLNDPNRPYYRRRAFTYPAYSTMVEVEILPDEFVTYRSQPHEIQSPRFTHKRQHSHPHMSQYSDEEYVHVWSYR